MKRTTILLEEETYERLRVLARRNGTTSSRMIREAVERYVVDADAGAPGPLDGLIGLFDGPDENLGEQTEAIVAAEVELRFPTGTAGARDRR